MKHVATPSFWACYKILPKKVQAIADNKFSLLKEDPRHPSLHFKKTGKFFSVRIGKKHRALAVQAEEAIVWFWIGTHAQYDDLIGRL